MLWFVDRFTLGDATKTGLNGMERCWKGDALRRHMCQVSVIISYMGNVTEAALYCCLSPRLGQIDGLSTVMQSCVDQRLFHLTGAPADVSHYSTGVQKAAALDPGEGVGGLKTVKSGSCGLSFQLVRNVGTEI